jgi:hypothetical protein
MTEEKQQELAEEISKNTPDEGKRVSNWKAFNESWAYVGKASKEPSIQIRAGDRSSAAILKGSILGAFLFLAVPFFCPKELALWCYAFADLLFFAAATLFVISRFGILRVMSMRHALVCWQLMVGTSLLSAVVALNLVLIVVLILAGPYINQLMQHQ